MKQKEDASSSPVSESVRTSDDSFVPAYATPLSQWRPDAPPQKESSPERPNWLPVDWKFKWKVRASGASAGVVDRYYISPAGTKFRSKTEVLHFLQTGTKRQKTLDPNPNSPSVPAPAPAPAPPPAAATSSSQQKEKKSNRFGRKKQKEETSKDLSNLNFDFKNPPQSVTWVLNDEPNNEWAPVVGNVVVPEAQRAQWSTAIECVTELEKGDGGAV